MKHRTAAASLQEPSHPGAHRRLAARGRRRMVGLVAALALVLGGGLAMALPATADPTDPITMPDARSPISLDLGVRYMRNGRVRYLRDGTERTAEVTLGSRASR